MKFALPIIVCFSLLLASCSFTTYQNRVSNVQKRSVIAQPVIVDVKVDLNRKVTGEGTGKIIELAKQAALSAAMEASNADVIVEPLYTVQHLDRSYKVKVVGFYGKYDNPRTFLDVIKETNNNGSLEKLLEYLNSDKTAKVITTKPAEVQSPGF
jgi:hypothetical protein